MTNLEKLANTSKETKRFDLLLLAFIKSEKVEEYCNAFKMGTVNRGRIAEPTLTHKPVDLGGKNGISNGDFIDSNGDIAECKYVTIKTSASKELKDTYAKVTYIIFNNGKEIQIRKYHKDELVYVDYNASAHHSAKSKITYRNNINRGELVRVFKDENK